MKNLYYTREEALQAALENYQMVELELSSADCDTLELEGDKAKQRLSLCCGEVNCYRTRVDDSIYAWWCETDDDDED